MVFQRAPKKIDLPNPKIGQLEARKTTHSYIEVQAAINGVKYDPTVNHQANLYQFKEKYKGRGIDLDLVFAQGLHTEHGEAIKDAFLQNKEGGPAAILAETLPMYANVPGRLGENIQARITKTAKQDDQGGSFIDLIIEIKNTWLAQGAPKELQDIPAKMTFLVDVTAAEDGEKYFNKMESFKRKMLSRGARAKVLCYENEFGDLGIEKPKIIIAKSPNYLEKVGGALGTYITQSAGDKFTINSPEAFNTEYRAYFLDLITAIGENATANATYMKSLSPDPKRQALIREYEKIVAFIEAYKKTPVTRTKQSA